MVLRAGWKERAKCKPLSPAESDDLFFYEAGQKANKARAFCRGCPVKQECLNYAVLYGEDGVWAGTTEMERQSLTFIREMLLVQTPISDLENRNFRAWLAVEVGEEIVEVIDIITSDSDSIIDSNTDEFDLFLLEPLQLIDGSESSTSNNERLAG